MLYILSLDEQFNQFLVENCAWKKKTKTDPLHGFIDIEDGSSTQQEVTRLELMLRQITNFAPVISRNTIIKNSTSLNNIW